MSNSINTPSAFAEGQEETIINAELKQKVNTEAVLNSELKQSWISNDKLDAELKQVVKSDSYLESELKQSWISNDKLDAELIQKVNSNDILESQLNIMQTNNSYLNSELIQKVIEDTILVSEISILVNKEVSLLSEMQLKFANNEVEIHSEMIFLDKEESSILAEIDYVDDESSNIDAEIVFKANDKSELKGEITQLVNSNNILDAEINQYWINDTKIDSELIFKANDKSELKGEITQLVNSEEYIESEIVLILNDNSYIESSLILSKICNDKIESELGLKFINQQSILSADICINLYSTLYSETVLFKTEVSELEASISLIEEKSEYLDAEITMINGKYLDAEITLSLNEESILDSEVSFVLTKDINAEIIFKDTDKSEVEAEITQLVNSKSELDSEINQCWMAKDELNTEMIVIVYDSSSLNAQLFFEARFITTSVLDAELILDNNNTSSYLDAEIRLFSMRYNSMKVSSEIVKGTNPKIQVYPTIDTFVRESEPFLNYNNVNSIRNGFISNDSYRGFITFDNLKNQEPKVRNNILCAKIYFKISSGNKATSITLTDNTELSSDATWYSYPKYVGDIATLEELNGYLVADITDYVRNVCQRKVVHESFGFAGDEYMSVYSLDSKYTPYIEIEYYDPSQLFATMHLNSELDMILGGKEILESELYLDFLNPTLPAELIVSKDSIYSEVNQVWRAEDYLDAQLLIPLDKSLSILDAEMILPKNYVVGIIPFGDSKYLDAELDADLGDESELEAELNVTLLSHIYSEVKFVYETEIDSEITIKGVSYKESELTLKFINNTSELDSQLIIKGASYAESELTLKFINNISELDSEFVLKFVNNQSSLDSLLNFELYTKLDSELRFFKQNVEDILEAQLHFDKYPVYTENSYLNAEINMAINSTDIENVLSSELILYSSRYNKINAIGEVVLRVNPTVKVYSDNDTFVRENEPFINYYNSQSLKSGIYNGEKYAAYIKFEDLINQNNVVNKNILSAKIVFKTLSSNTANYIELYDIDNFDEKSITWLKQPETFHNLYTLSNENGYLTADITEYVKKICLRKDIHEGFALVTDKFMNVYSSNSNYKPYIEIEYYDPNALFATKYIESSIDFLLTDSLDSEIFLEFKNPTLPAELIYSKNSIVSEITQIWKETNAIEAELITPYKSEIDYIDAECLYSKFQLDSEINLGTTSSLDAELIAYVTIDSNLEAELDVTLVSHIYSEVKFVYEDKLDSELVMHECKHLPLDAEILYSKNFIVSEVDLLFDKKLDSEITFKSTNNVSELDSEITFKSTNNASELYSEINIVHINNSTIDSEIIIKNASYKEAEITFKSTNNVSELESECSLLHRSDVDAELSVLFTNKLDAQLCLSFIDNITIDAELTAELISAKSIVAEIIQCWEDNSEIDAETRFLSENNESSIYGSLHLSTIYREKIYLDAEINLDIAVVNNYLSAELLLYSTRYNRINITSEIIKRENPKVIVYPDNDTFVTDKQPFLNYYTNSTIKQGMYEGYEYKGFITFNDLINLDHIVNNNILSAKIVFRKASGNKASIINVYEAENFNEREITWFKHPGNYGNLFTLTEEDKLLSADITDYVRNVCQRKIVHDGFGFETDKFMNVYSSNSNYKPYIEIEYYDPNALFATKYLESELDFKLYNYLDSEIFLEFKNPTLPAEVIVSKDSVASEITQIWTSNEELNAELRLFTEPEYSRLSSELLFSKTNNNAELLLAETITLDSELQLGNRDKSELEAELNVTLVSHIYSEVKFVYETKIDSEMIAVVYNRSIIDAETTFISTTEDHINSELELAFRGEDTSILDSEIIFSKDFMLSEINVGLLEADSINSEITLLLNGESIKEAALYMIFGGKSYIDAELTVRSLKGFNILDSEMIFNAHTENYLNAEITLLSEEESILNSEVKFVYETDIESELVLEFNEDISIDSEMKVSFKDIKKYIDANMILINIAASSLKSEVNLALPGDNDLDAELNLVLQGKSVLYAEVFVGEMSVLDASLDCKLSTADYMDAELLLYSTRYNRMNVTQTVMPLINPKMRIYSDNDTFVHEEIPYLSYYDSSTLKTGTYNNDKFEAFISFDELNNLPEMVKRNIVYAKLVFRESSGTGTEVFINDIDYAFNEAEITFEYKPESVEQLFTMEKDGSEFTVDVTEYVRSIINGRNHYGFEIATNDFISLYSSNSSYKPYIEIEYVDPSSLMAAKFVDAEVSFKALDSIDSELFLEFKYPTIEAELIVSKDSVSSELIQSWISTESINAELSIMDANNLSTIKSELVLQIGSKLDAEIIFSKDFMNAEINYVTGNNNSLNAELIFKSTDNIYINSEIELRPSSLLNSELLINYVSYMNSEVLLAASDHSIINSELQLTPISYINSELYLNMSSILNSEVIFLSTEKSILESELIVSFPERSYLNSEVKFALENNIDGLLDIRFIKVLGSEVKFLSQNNEDILDSEVMLTRNIVDSLLSELTLIYDNIEESINAEIKFVYTTELDSELVLEFNKEEQLDAELKLINNAQSALNAEMGVIFIGQSTIESSINFFNRNDLESEITFRAVNRLYAEINLYDGMEECELDSELKLELNDRSELRAELNIVKMIFSYVQSIQR